MAKYIRYGKEYERKDRKKNFDKNLTIKVNDYLMSEIKEAANRLSETSSKFVRETLERRIKELKNNETNN